MPTPALTLSSGQLAQLNAYNQSGAYAEGYRYLRDIANSASGTGDLASWLDKAASIKRNQWKSMGSDSIDFD